MPSVGEHNAFVNSPKHMCGFIISRKSHKCRFPKRMGIGAIQERKVIDIALFCFYTLHQFVAVFINAFSFRKLLVFHAVLEIPFQISGGSGAALLCQIVAWDSKQRVHRYISVHNRRFRNKFIDAPSTCNGHKLFGGSHIRRHCAGINVKHTSGHRCSHWKTGQRRSLFADRSAQIIGIFHRSQLPVYFSNSQLFKQSFVKSGIFYIHKTGTGNIRSLTVSLAGQPEPHIIFYGKHILNVVVDIPVMIFEPCQQRCLLTGHQLLAKLSVKFLMNAFLVPLLWIFPRTVISGNDAVVCRLLVLSPRIQSFSMSAYCNTQHIPAINSSLFQCFFHTLTVGKPKLLHIPFRISGLGSDCLRMFSRCRNLIAHKIENGCLCGCSAVIKADQILSHFVLLFKFRVCLEILPGFSEQMLFLSSASVRKSPWSRKHFQTLHVRTDAVLNFHISLQIFLDSFVPDVMSSLL